MLEKIDIRKKHVRKSYVFVGVAAIVFGIIGALVVLSNIISFSMNIFNDTDTKREMEKLVTPLVMMDVSPMVKMDRATEPTIVLSSLWYCLTNEDNQKYLDTNEGKYIVPQTDVESYCVKMFGEGYKPVHQTVGDYENEYRYDKEKQAYYVPLQTKSGNYRAKVESYSQNGEFYYVRIGYVSPGAIWDLNIDMKTKKPDKYMEYVLKKSGGKFIVVAVNEDPQVQNPDGKPQTPSSKPEDVEQKNGNV